MGLSNNRLSSRCVSLQSIRNPDLDNRLTGHSEAPCRFVQPLNHPVRKSTFTRLCSCPDLLKRQIEEFCDVLAAVKFVIQFLGLHKFLPPLSWIAGRR